MPVYFVTCTGIPVVKIGHTKDPKGRLITLRTWSPVPLQLAAVDLTGDKLTEAELLYRFRADRMHGEWFAASGALNDVIVATAESGVVPGGWKIPENCPHSWFDTINSAPHSYYREKFGLTRSESIDLFGASIGSYCRPSVMHVPRAFFYIRAKGHDITLADMWPSPAEATP